MFPQPEISSILIIDDASPYSNHSTLIIGIENVPIYDSKKPRYAFFYSYKKAPDGLNLEYQDSLNCCQWVVPSGKNRKLTEFYFQLHYEDKDFYLSLVDSILEKVIFQTKITKEQIENLKKAKHLEELLSKEFFNKDLETDYATDNLTLESYRRLNVDGDDKDYYSVSFVCNNSCNEDNFKVVLTKFYDDETHQHFTSEISLEKNRLLEENKDIEILHKCINHRRGYVVFSVPTVDMEKEPYYINVIDDNSGRFFARTSTIYENLEKREEGTTDNERTVFNDPALYQRWFK